MLMYMRKKPQAVTHQNLLDLPVNGRQALLRQQRIRLGEVSAPEEALHHSSSNPERCITSWPSPQLAWLHACNGR